MCRHEQFEADVQVARATGRGTTRFWAEIGIVCAQCKTRFRFPSLNQDTAKLEIEPQPQREQTLMEMIEGMTP